MRNAEPITEEQFRKALYEKFSEHFRHVYELHKVAEEAIGAFHALVSSPYEATLSLIFGRAYKAFDSIRRLCEVTSTEDAGVLLRSLLNLMAVTRWISLEPRKYAKRYFDWYWVSLKRDSEKFPGKFPQSWIPEVEKHFQKVKKDFEYLTAKNKLKMAEQWYQPDANNIRELFEQVDLKNHYEEAYGPLSSIEHSDINAFFAMYRQIEKNRSEKRLEIQSDLFVPHYLRNAFQYFGDVFRICNKTIPLTDGAKLEEVISAGMTFYADDMKTRGMEPF